MSRRILLVTVLILFTSFNSVVAAQGVPARLSDAAFWKLVTDFSEEGGYFRSDNFVSNEMTFQYVIPELKEKTKPGGVYLGVGPDQNFTYILALQPKIAFIFDIRRQNLVQHLMYKALFEISQDRVEFLSRLFSRRRPANLEPRMSSKALFDAFAPIEPDRGLFAQNLEAIENQLTGRHGFTLTPDDKNSLEYVFRSFFAGGQDLTYNGLGPSFRDRRMPSYAEIMVQTDQEGLNRGYMGSEENFQVVKALEEANLIVPLVGDFAGPMAIRKVGQYLKERQATVTAFYLSNVEQYLFQQGDDWSKFYKNVETLPMDSASTFIRSLFSGPAAQSPLVFASISLLCPMQPLVKAVSDGSISTYYGVIQMSH